jgi:hypothetical protein
MCISIRLRQTASSGGTVQIKGILKNRGTIVAQTTTTAKLAPNEPVRVLFRPKKGFERQRV